MKPYRLKLLQILSAMDALAFRYFLKVVRSPALNQHKELIQFGEFLEEASPNFPAGTSFKEQAFSYLYGPEAKYDDLRIRHLMSLMVNLAELSLALPKWRNSLDQDLIVGEKLAGMGLGKEFASVRKRMERSLEKTASSEVSPEFYYDQYRWRILEQNGRQFGFSTPGLSLAFASLDHFYLISKYRQACIFYSHQTLNQKIHPPQFLKEVKQFELITSEIPPLLSLYQSALAAMESPAADHLFQAFVSQLDQQQQQLAKDSGMELHILARNFCIRRMNSGDHAFSRRLYQLYQLALRGKFIHDDQGHILPSAFKNIVSTGIKLGDMEGVDKFISACGPDLAERFRQDYLTLSYGRLHFASQNYRKAAQSLREATYSDTFMELDGRILLCKTWYELEELDLFEALVASTEKMLKRRDLKTYHQKAYRKTLVLLRWLVLSSPGLEKTDRQRRQWEELMATDDFPERDWFQEKVSELGR